MTGTPLTIKVLIKKLFKTPSNTHRGTSERKREREREIKQKIVARFFKGNLPNKHFAELHKIGKYRGVFDN